MSTTEIMHVQYTPDGDTLKCLRTVTESGRPRSEEVRVRLAFIDAPEFGEPSSYAYAVSARAYLRRLLYIGERVQVTLHGTDAYGRLIGEVVSLRDYAHCGLRLVQGGYAALWNCPDDRSAYHAAQAHAQQKRLGIWRVPGPWQTPWLYR
jgi:endonuclease YncB( thermonuclease family)